MKKLLALILAVVMAASLSVVGLAEEGIQARGGGDSMTTLYALFYPVTDRYENYIGTNGQQYSRLVTYGVSNPNETEENSGEGVVEWSAPKAEFEVSGNEFAREGVKAVVRGGGDAACTYIGGDPEVTSVTTENGLLTVRKTTDHWGIECYILKAAQPLTEAGTIEDTIIAKTPKAMYKEKNNVADKDNGPFTYKFPIAITVTGDIPADTGNSGGSSSDKSEPSPTENAANNDKTLDKLSAGESAEVKLTSGSAALSTDTINTLGGHSGKLTVTVDKMTVAIPGGFGMVNEPGRIYYPMDFSDNLANAGDLAAAVKGDKAKTEVVKAGGDMVMPTTVTVTLKTKLTGTVNVYYYNPETRRYTLLASPVAKDGKITFTTKQMGHLVLTTGTI